MDNAASLNLREERVVEYKEEADDYLKALKRRPRWTGAPYIVVATPIERAVHHLVCQPRQRLINSRAPALRRAESRPLATP